MAALERIRAAIPADDPGRRRRQAGRHRLDGRPPGRRPVRRPGRRRDHGQSVPRRPRAFAPFLERADRYAYVLCRTSNPGSDELQDLRGRRADADRRPPAEPLHERVARHVAGWGPGGTVGLVVGATAPDELAPDPGDRPGPRLPRPGRRRPGWRQSSRSSRDGPATAAPAGGRPGRRACSSTSRGGSPGRRRSTTPAPASVRRTIRVSGSPRPPGIGRPLWRCPCYRRIGADPEAPRAVRSTSLDRRSDRRSEVDQKMPNISDQSSSIIVLVIALIVHRPGQAARGRRRPRQEHQGVPQGGHRHHRDGADARRQRRSPPPRLRPRRRPPAAPVADGRPGRRSRPAAPRRRSRPGGVRRRRRRSSPRPAEPTRRCPRA